LRRAVFERAGCLGDPPSEDQVPAALRAYVDKVAHAAYKVIDEDVDALRERYGTRGTYEITVAAALGAAAVRREAALELVRGGSQ